MVVISILTWILHDMVAIQKSSGWQKSHLDVFWQKWAIFGDFWVFRGLQKIFHGKIHELIIDCSCTKYPYMDFT